MWRMSWTCYAMTHASSKLSVGLWLKPSGARLVWSSFNEGSDKGNDERALMRLHDLSQLLAFYTLLRWPQTPCHQAHTCHCPGSHLHGGQWLRIWTDYDRLSSTAASGKLVKAYGKSADTKRYRPVQLQAGLISCIILSFDVTCTLSGKVSGCSWLRQVPRCQNYWSRMNSLQVLQIEHMQAYKIARFEKILGRFEMINDYLYDSKLFEKAMESPATKNGLPNRSIRVERSFYNNICLA